MIMDFVTNLDDIESIKGAYSKALQVSFKYLNNISLFLIILINLYFSTLKVYYDPVILALKLSI